MPTLLGPIASTAEPSIVGTLHRANVIGQVNSQDVIGQVNSQDVIGQVNSQDVIGQVNSQGPAQSLSRASLMSHGPRVIGASSQGLLLQCERLLQ
jgi:hypothetical protein